MHPDERSLDYRTGIRPGSKDGKRVFCQNGGPVLTQKRLQEPHDPDPRLRFTLRDGAQAQGISYSVDDKDQDLGSGLTSWHQLWSRRATPGSNPKDLEFLQARWRTQAQEYQDHRIRQYAQGHVAIEDDNKESLLLKAGPARRRSRSSARAGIIRLSISCARY